MKKIKFHFGIYKYLIHETFWAVARLWGYWFKNKTVPYQIIFGYSNYEQYYWWQMELAKLNIKRFKLDKKLYKIKKPPKFK